MQYAVYLEHIFNSQPVLSTSTRKALSILPKTDYSANLNYKRQSTCRYMYKLVFTCNMCYNKLVTNLYPKGTALSRQKATKDGARRTGKTNAILPL